MNYEDIKLVFVFNLKKSSNVTFNVNGRTDGQTDKQMAGNQLNFCHGYSHPSKVAIQLMTASTCFSLVCVCVCVHV